MLCQPVTGRIGAPMVLTLALLAFSTATFTHASATTLSILPLGDSITWGYSPVDVVPAGYRGTLYQDLTSAGYNVQMVGTETANPDLSLPPASYGQEGHSGWAVEGQGFLTGGNNAGNIATWLAPNNGINPNLILLEIGNDNIWGSYNVKDAPYALGAMITEITSLRPDAKVLLTTLTPMANAAFETEVQAFNKALEGPDGIVAQLQKLGENVVLVNAGGSLTLSDLSPDGGHPSKVGYAALGDAWFQAVEANLPTPTPEPSTLMILGAGTFGILAWVKAKGNSVELALTLCDEASLVASPLVGEG